ncbi:histidine kinase, partial [Streptomyces sp. NRRL WC-3753]
MQRLYDFIRRHPTWVDCFWAVVLLGVSSMELLPADPGAPRRIALVPHLVIIVVFCVVVALRRKAPERMLLLAVAGGVAQLILDVPVIPADFAMLVVIHTAAAHGEKWASR